MSDPHVRLFAWLTNSAAWRAMSGNAIKVTLYVASFDDGKNNGEIFMSERHASEGTGLNRKTVRRAFEEAQEKGFLVRMSAGSFRLKRSPAAKWRLTWKSSPPLSMAATNDWRKWEPKEKSRGQELPRAGVKIPIKEKPEASDGVKNTHATEATSQISANQDVGNIGPQIIATAGQDAADAIHALISDWWRKARPKERMALASNHSLTVGELLSYVMGESALPFPKLVAIRSSIAGPIGKAAA